ncbi:T9SS type A sorting domain-containing protein [Bizionia myxarmorum]|uniref:T9SS type A sorting domain-containing protein n=1 Tax=Bizionia myxarmorum TaxID=291186 RepID=A0A5D0R407_9FLAO|nr:T9SS type A sorting domain-containing protein [Bizionia myxarmorum]TYB76320.1 T9SS type A sorting domain-containing protein [Bizionia myxarmorum]
MSSTNSTFSNNRFSLLATLILLSGFSYAQTTTAISDANFEQALINQGIDTNGFNGTILNSDAESIISLNIYDKNINDLTGIEAFVNLRHLYGYNNNISQLDLSHNLALTILDVENNGIENLNISQNINLEELYVSNNLLQALTVSHLLDLAVLSANLNNLNSLNVSNNSKLEALWCYSNNISILDLSNNYELESLFCGDNNLNALNISNNFDLETLSCASNNLHAISFSDCSDISFIDISNNLFTELDLTQNSGVKRLMCDNNFITELELFNAPNLFLLYATNNLIEHIDVSMNDQLRHIRLGNNQLQTIDIRNSRNDKISAFNADNNEDLSCIFVDNTNAPYLSNWVIDIASHFVSSETGCNALSVADEPSLVSFEIYPNPASDYLNIRNLQPNSNISIFNTNGQMVKQHNGTSGLNTLDISHLSSGMYLVKVASLNQSLIKKIIVN